MQKGVLIVNPVYSLTVVRVFKQKEKNRNGKKMVSIQNKINLVIQGS